LVLKKEECRKKGRGGVLEKSSDPVGEGFPAHWKKHLGHRTGKYCLGKNCKKKESHGKRGTFYKGNFTISGKAIFVTSGKKRNHRVREKERLVVRKRGKRSLKKKRGLERATPVWLKMYEKDSTGKERETKNMKPVEENRS